MNSRLFNCYCTFTAFILLLIFFTNMSDTDKTDKKIDSQDQQEETKSPIRNVIIDPEGKFLISVCCLSNACLKTVFLHLNSRCLQIYIR